MSPVPKRVSSDILAVLLYMPFILTARLFDKLGFKIPFIIINICEILISVSIYFTVDTTVLFSFLLVISGAFMAGCFALLPAVTSKIFGLK